MALMCMLKDKERKFDTYSITLQTFIIEASYTHGWDGHNICALAITVLGFQFGVAYNIESLSSGSYKHTCIPPT